MKSSKLNKTIGVITVPVGEQKQYADLCGDSFVSSTYTDWLKKYGLKILPIPFDTTHHEYFFERINCLYFPGGAVEGGSNNANYYNCCKKFVDLAIKANDNGDYFAIWGTCLGLQQLLIIADGNNNHKLLENYDSYNSLKVPLLFTNDCFNSSMFNYVLKNEPRLLTTLMDQNITENNHMLGLSPITFNRKQRLKSFFMIVSYSYDRQGKSFISMIEGKNYPFYGVQWHPEIDPKMDIFAKFLTQEANKNHHNKKFPKHLKLQERTFNCYKSYGIYRVCHFYWHKKTSQSVMNACRPHD